MNNFNCSSCVLNTYMFGRPSLASIKEQICGLIDTNLPILILGSSGTGKSMLAKQIFQSNCNSKYKKNLVSYNCAGRNPDIMYRELVGTMPGSFTGAISKEVPGLIDQAEEGTLFLDEIGCSGLDFQAAILTLIEDNTFRRIGGLQEKNVNLRIISATNSQLKDHIQKEKFREDLYYRLSACTLTLPDFNDCVEEEKINLIYLLTLQLIKKEEIKVIGEIFEPEALQKIISYSWDGNIRELYNFLKITVLKIKSRNKNINFYIKKCDIQLDYKEEKNKVSYSDVEVFKHLPEDWSLDVLEQHYIQYIMSKFTGNKSQVAKLLGVSRDTLYRKLLL